MIIATRKSVKIKAESPAGHLLAGIDAPRGKQGGILTVKNFADTNIPPRTPPPAKHRRQAEPAGNALAVAVQLIRRGVRPVRRTGWMVGVCLVLGMGPAAGPAGAGLWDALRKTVVLDPGHGGQDTGVRGPGGTLEKDVALSFARLMVTRLKAAYRVVLTRTDDYAVTIPMRTAAANHEKADLFLSIHAAGSLNPESHGIELFCFEASLPPDTTQGSPPGGGGDAKKRPRRWDRLQLGHQSECEAFAGMLQTTVRHATGVPVRIHRAPLSVLKGADMPAVLVEIGYLTHSQEETRLQNPAELAVLADSVCDAVFDYLK